jgi:endonuclease/exonuclease/phosphatase family metal-dependent hydrolase
MQIVRRSSSVVRGTLLLIATATALTGTSLAGCASGGGGGGAAPPAAATSTPAQAARGTIEVLSYNVAGLPDLLSGSSPAVNTPQISPLLNAYDLVLVQEDFSYHAALARDALHPHQSVPQSGQTRLMNDGLNRFSIHPFTPVQREIWATCHGIWAAANDCLAAKGFSFARHTLAPNVEIDVYNLHADAGGAQGDITARQQQMEQLKNFILLTSADRALVVAGDFNLHGFAPDDEPIFAGLLLAIGLEDSCRAIACGQERIDRVLFRSGREVLLQPLAWRLADEFVDPGGASLSDHEAIHVRLAWEEVP